MANETGEVSRLGLLARSFASKFGVLIGVFFAVPLLIYGEFQAADEDKQRLLHKSLDQQGQIIAKALRPELEAFDGTSGAAVRNAVSRFAPGGPNVKLLFRPKGAGDSTFYYIAAAPKVPDDYLAAEKRDMQREGVLQRLGASCSGGRSFAIRYRNPAGQEELLTSITPVKTEAGCWAVVTSHSASDLLGSVLARPYWGTPEVKVATIIYFLAAVLIIFLFVSVWRSIRRFSAQARAIRMNATSAQNPSFQNVNRIPELDGVAREFDRMVDALQDSARAIRHAAEDNAHAFKTPLAIISQSIEPLKRSVQGVSERGERAVELIERAVQRLDALVSAARRMDEATADMLESASQRINLSALTEELLASYQESLRSNGIKLDNQIHSNIYVDAAPEPIETVLENLLDNAIDFSPHGSVLTVYLDRNGRDVCLEVADGGPGVPDDQLPHLFSRYVSDRSKQVQNLGNAHSGIGLWLVKRHVEAMGGEVSGRNLAPNGFAVEVRLPTAA